MDTPETSPEEPPIEGRPVPRRRRGGGVSAESLLASVLLHLAVLFLVILFAPNGKGREHDAVLVDISKFVLPESSSPRPDPAPPTPAQAEAPEAAQPAAGDPVQIPSEEAAAPADEPPKAAEEAAAPAEAKAEPRPEAPATPAPAETAKAAPTPPVPETSLPHGHGAYDPFEVYKATLAERVNKAMAPVLNTSPVLRVFRGRLVVHLYLESDGRLRWFTDQDGLEIRGAAICLHHKGYQIEPIIPMNEPTFLWYTEGLDAEVIKAINDGAPYPEAPPGLTIPPELSYIFDLPERGFHHPPIPPAPAAGSPGTPGVPQG